MVERRNDVGTSMNGSEMKNLADDPKPGCHPLIAPQVDMTAAISQKMLITMTRVLAVNRKVECCD